MTIHITSYGTGIPLVFFHGWGFDSQVWKFLIPYFEESYQLILVDLPGFGLSPLQDWNSFKSNLLSRLPPKFIVTGWSLGGLFATRLAIEEQERVIKLVNITSSPRFISDVEWPGVSREVFAHFYKNLSLDINKTLQEFVTLQLNKHKFEFNSGVLPSKSGLESGLKILDEWDLRPGLNSLNTPTCFMFGRLDPITPVRTMHYMQKIYPDFNYVLFNKAAHMPFLSHTDVFIEQFSGFIQ
ncbi:alpha/beta fold hydrolase [Legionella quateirensis]|uniref:Pimeloyl-[acyl-carrier protein] methyl ester esterase n=1 Tax=Legionella quateirensis TaxID=45072 RepID=A0A378KTN7_9GAMM|nr:alpha/beta fold hydrolase [Legionella quateirensis]KTD50833.1 biotin biosynthesis protein BioH [Legionella quateirensis]STY17922.1 biotin operon repressor and biotin [Legionella quateirensis]